MLYFLSNNSKSQNMNINEENPVSLKEISGVEVEELLDEIEPEINKSPRFGTDLVTNNWINECQESGR